MPSYRKGDIITLHVTGTHSGGYLKAETVNGGEQAFDLFTRVGRSGVSSTTLRKSGVHWDKFYAVQPSRAAVATGKQKRRY